MMMAHNRDVCLWGYAVSYGGFSDLSELLGGMYGYPVAVGL